jgi:hypothetical protein
MDLPVAIKSIRVFDDRCCRLRPRRSRTLPTPCATRQDSPCRLPRSTLVCGRSPTTSAANAGISSSSPLTCPANSGQQDIDGDRPSPPGPVSRPTEGRRRGGGLHTHGKPISLTASHLPACSVQHETTTSNSATLNKAIHEAQSFGESTLSVKESPHHTLEKAR